MNNMFKSIGIWLIVGLVLMTVFKQVSQTQQSSKGPIDYSQFLEEVRQGQIAKVTIEGRTLKAVTIDGKTGNELRAQ